MMKKILTVAFAAMMLVSIPVSAQQRSGEGKARKAKTERTIKRDMKFDRRAEAKCLQVSDPCPVATQCRPGGCEFEGLDLTEQQKSQLKTLKENQRKEMKARVDSAKAARKEAKAEARAERKAMKERREAEHREYLKEVKKILGNDKYVMFLENQYVQDAGRPESGMDKRMAPVKGKKHAKDMQLRSDRKEKKGGK